MSLPVYLLSVSVSVSNPVAFEMINDMKVLENPTEIILEPDSSDAEIITNYAPFPKKDGCTVHHRCQHLPDAANIHTLASSLEDIGSRHGRAYPSCRLSAQTYQDPNQMIL